MTRPGRLNVPIAIGGARPVNGGIRSSTDDCDEPDGLCRSVDVRPTEASKLPRPTRSLPPCGGRSLLEGGAFPQRHCAPRPHAWTRPGFLLPSTGWAAGRSGCCDPRLRDPSRGLSRRFNSRCSRALSPTGERESNLFAVVVPECRTRRRCLGPQEPVYLWLLPSSACARAAVNQKTAQEVKTGCHTVKVNEDGRSSRPYRSLGSRLEEGAPRPAPLPLILGKHRS